MYMQTIVCSNFKMMMFHESFISKDMKVIKNCNTVWKNLGMLE